jgi:excisionase family DNA binding protein
LPESNPPEFLTPKEAADLLRVSERTLYEWLKAGHVKALRLGVRGRGVWRIPRAALPCGGSCPRAK